jgi:hypothetical protein
MHTRIVWLSCSFVLLSMVAGCRGENRVYEQDVLAESGAMLQPSFGGIELAIPAEALASDSSVRIEEVQPPDGDTTSALSPVYSIEIGSDAVTPIEIRIKIPETGAGEIAQPYLIRWTGDEWQYLEAYNDDGWLTTRVSSFSDYAIGFATEIVLERADGSMEAGRLQVVRANEQEYAVLYNSAGARIDASTVADYRGGVIYHADGVDGFSLALDMLTNSGLPLSSFRQALFTYVANQMEQIYGDTVENVAGVVLFEMNSWDSSCQVGDGYNVESSLSVTYRVGRAGYSSGTGYGPWLYLRIERVGNLVGNRVVFVLYSDAPVMSFEMNAADLQPQRTYRIELPLMDDQVPIPNMRLVALVAGTPRIPWWQFWEDRDERFLCAYGDLVSPETVTTRSTATSSPSPTQTPIATRTQARTSTPTRGSGGQVDPSAKVINIVSETSATARPSQPLALTIGWAAATREQVQDYIDSVRIDVAVDGRTYTITGASYGPIQSRASCTDGARTVSPCAISRLTYGIPGFAAGTYVISIRIGLSRQVDDGFDTYGPGEISQYTITLTVR